MLFSNINEEDLIILDEFKKKNTLYIEVKTVNRGCICKNCGTYHTDVKEYILKKITHSIFHNTPCTLLYHHRRFLCPKCGKTAMDINPFCSESHHISARLFIRKETITEVRNVLGEISDRERAHLHYRFGFLDYVLLDQSETAAHFHLSLNRARHAEKAALNIVRRALPG